MIKVSVEIHNRDLGSTGKSQTGVGKELDGVRSNGKKPKQTVTTEGS